VLPVTESLLWTGIPKPYGPECKINRHPKK
jgi:hypothetical protein